MFLEPILVLSVLIPENLAQIQTKSSCLVGVPEPVPPEEPGCAQTGAGATEGPQSSWSTVCPRRPGREHPAGSAGGQV